MPPERFYKSLYCLWKNAECRPPSGGWAASASAGWAAGSSGMGGTASALPWFPMCRRTTSSRAVSMRSGSSSLARPTSVRSSAFGVAAKARSRWSRATSLVSESSASSNDSPPNPLRVCAEIDKRLGRHLEVDIKDRGDQQHGERIRRHVAARRADGEWDEAPYNAVGFPRVFYLRYHGYRLYFPLMALALGMGVYPKPLTDVMEPTLQHLVQLMSVSKL